MNIPKGQCNACKQYAPIITVHHHPPYAHHKDYFCWECLKVRVANSVITKDNAGRYYYSGRYICNR
jgi:hypothetical protein